MSLAWVNNYDPTERWWSVEVSFDSILDEIFGVVNNKQHAHAFVEGAGFDWKSDTDGSELYKEFVERLEETDDPRRHLIEVWGWIDDQIKSMRREYATMTKGVRGKRHPHPQTGEDVEDVATRVIRQQAKDGRKGETDRAPTMSDEEKKAKIIETAMQKKVDEPTAQRWARETVDGKRRVLIKSVNLDNPHAFFNVEWANDVVEIWLNGNHAVHQHLIEILSEDTEDTDREELVDRIGRAAFTFRMMLVAWGRYEDKTPKDLKLQVEDMRSDWGREIREFLKAIES